LNRFLASAIARSGLERRDVPADMLEHILHEVELRERLKKSEEETKGSSRPTRDEYRPRRLSPIPLPTLPSACSPTRRVCSRPVELFLHALERSVADRAVVQQRHEAPLLDLGRRAVT
jgi:hypothetical protein